MMMHMDMKVIGEALLESGKGKLIAPLKNKFNILGCMYLIKYAIDIPNLNHSEKSHAFLNCSIVAYRLKEIDLSRTLAKEGLRHRPNSEVKLKLSKIVKACDSTKKEEISAV